MDRFGSRAKVLGFEMVLVFASRYESTRCWGLNENEEPIEPRCLEVEGDGKCGILGVAYGGALDGIKKSLYANVTSRYNPTLAELFAAADGLKWLTGHCDLDAFTRWSTFTLAMDAPYHFRHHLLLRAHLFDYHAGIHYGGIESLFTNDIDL